ncbi:MAG: T9SS type A sorting domain-containing protein [Bacteroidia bacterium]|nr:T9SS type A sorting domain-containing protein [Bacteroidia bacterium]
MKKIILIIIVLDCHFLFSQVEIDKKRDNIWCFGYAYSPPLFGRSIVDFSNDTAVVSYLNNPNIIRLDATNASISDTTGNLLFYTNGIKVINKTHELMENGDSLTYGHYSFEHWYPNYGYNTIQGAMILPVPESKDLYYVFYSGWDIAPSLPEQIICPSVLYATVDMSKNGGLGKVIRKDQVLINDTIGIPNVAACRHANGRDWWLLFKGFRKHRFHRVLLTPDGFIMESSLDFGGNRMDMWSQTVFSPDGKLFIQGGLEAGTMQSPFHLHLYDFDRCTGILSNYRHIQDNEPYLYTGCAVSPNSRYLYYSSQSNKVYQLDLQAIDVIGSRQLVAVMDTAYVDSVAQIYGTAGFSTMQLGPDDKIYVNAASRSLHIIDSPDSAGLACNIIRQGLALPAINQLWCIPNFPYFRLGAEVGTICDSLTVGISAPFGSAQGAVYPNPADETVMVSFPTPERAVFILMDLQGREILRQAIEEQKTAIAVGNLPTGAYFYKIEINNRNEYGKLWIVR